MNATSNGTALSAVLVLAFAGAPAAVADTVQTLIGDIDGFVYTPGSPDDVYVSSALWDASYSPSTPRGPFDTLTPNRNVPFTLTIPPVPSGGGGGGGSGEPSTLTLAIRATDASGVLDDTISFFDYQCANRLDYTYQQLGWLPVPNSGVVMRQVDLTTILQALETRGELNVLVGTHTAIDYAILETPKSHWPRCYYGDANGDLFVDLQDYGILKDHFGLTAGATWEVGDFNSDGAVDLQDFGILKDNFGLTPGDPLTSVPEPATLGIALVLLPLVSRRLRLRATR